MRDVMPERDVSKAEAVSVAAPASASLDAFAVYGALYGALGLIAAIVFGTLSYHPF